MLHLYFAQVFSIIEPSSAGEGDSHFITPPETLSISFLRDSIRLFLPVLLSVFDLESFFGSVSTE